MQPGSNARRRPVARELLLKFEHLEALGGRRRERLLAEHVLAGPQCRERERNVKVIRRRDDHGVDVVGRDCRRRVDLDAGDRRARLGDHLGRAFGVEVGEHREVCTLDFALNTKGVVGAHEAGADDRDSDGHVAPFLSAPGYSARAARSTSTEAVRPASGVSATSSCSMLSTPS
jgi:hypothetical protein